MRAGLRIALIGQSVFAARVFERLRQHGHLIVGVFTIPDKGKKEDPLGKVFGFLIKRMFFLHRVINGYLSFKLR